MLRFLPALALLPLLACDGATPADPSDADTSEDTQPVESDLPGETDDSTDTDTDVATKKCKLGALVLRAVATGEPSDGETVTYTRTIEACASSTGIEGSWRVDVVNESDERVCGFTVAFDSTSTTDNCESCEVAFHGVSWHDATFSNTTLCALFSLDEDFVSGLNDSSDNVGVASDGPDLLVADGEGAWSSLDPTEETARTSEQHTDAVRISLVFETSYAW